MTYQSRTVELRYFLQYIVMCKVTTIGGLFLPVTVEGQVHLINTFFFLLLVQSLWKKVCLHEHSKFPFGKQIIRKHAGTFFLGV